jgi:hypothetical protein
VAVRVILEELTAWTGFPGAGADRSRLHQKEVIVSRMQFCLTLFAAGLSVVFLCPGLTSSAQPVWEPAEEQSVVFNQSSGPPARRSAYSTTGLTLSRWRGPRISRAVVTGPAAGASSRGARMSLVSLTSTSSTVQTCEDGPDIVPANTSVNATNGSGPLAQQCSTALYNYGIDDYCSVGINNGIVKQFCSTSTNGNGPAGSPFGAYCSTNLGNQGGPVTCSVYGAALGPALNSCSAGVGPANVTPTCSTQTDSSGEMAGSYCSVVLDVGQAVGQCSTGGLSGNAGNNGNAFCSATTGQLAPGGPAQGNNCSVFNANGPGANSLNTCSTDGNGNCSVTNPNKLGGKITTDQCSVIATAGNANSHAQCTVTNGGAGGNGQCSAFSGNPPVAVPGQTQCSIISPVAPKFTPPVGGLCTVP